MSADPVYEPDNSEVIAGILALVAAAAMRWRAAQLTLDDARYSLLCDVRQAHAAGMSEYELARAAGVTRNTVRAWLGKGKA